MCGSCVHQTGFAGRGSHCLVLVRPRFPTSRAWQFSSVKLQHFVTPTLTSFRHIDILMTHRFCIQGAPSRSISDVAVEVSEIDIWQCQRYRILYSSLKLNLSQNRYGHIIYTILPFVYIYIYRRLGGDSDRAKRKFPS